MCMSALLTGISLYHMCAWNPGRLEEGIGAPGTGITDDSELPGECWELNSGPLKKPPLLFTTEPSLQLLLLYFC